MKKKGIWIAALAAMCFSTACGAEKTVPVATQEMQVAGAIDEKKDEDTEEFEAEDFDDFDEEEEYYEIEEEDDDDETDDDFDETEYEEPEVEPNLISFDDMQDSYENLVELYNSLLELYSSDMVPQDDDVDAVIEETGEWIDDFREIKEEDIPRDEDRYDILTDMNGYAAELNEMIQWVSEVEKELSEAEAEQEYYEQLLDIVEDNSDYMNSYFDAAWSYFSNYGGTDDQVTKLLAIRDEIEGIQNMDSETVDGLNEINTRIQKIIGMLDDLERTK